MITMCTVTITFNSGKQKDTLRGPETLYCSISAWTLYGFCLPLLKGFQVVRRRSSFNCKKMYIWIMNLFSSRRLVIAQNMAKHVEAGMLTDCVAPKPSFWEQNFLLKIVN